MENLVNYLEDRIDSVLFLSGLVFIIASLILYKFPPKKINNFYGYRTTSSMKSQIKWDFSQKYSAVKMLQTGLALILFSFINHAAFISSKFSNFISIGLLIFGCIYLFLSTEKAIKKKFPNQ